MPRPITVESRNALHKACDFVPALDAGSDWSCYYRQRSYIADEELDSVIKPRRSVTTPYMC